MQFDDRCHYNRSHEWVRIEGHEAVVGISDYAQDQLSNVVFVELPQVDDTFRQGDVFVVVESVKAASECYLPVSGRVVAINEDLLNAPELVNEAPYGQGWLVRIAPSDLSEVDGLMDAAQYEAHVAQLAEEDARR